MSKNDDDFGLSIIKDSPPVPIPLSFHYNLFGKMLDESELRLDDEMKFMENFDPEKSKREQRKLNRKFTNYSAPRKTTTSILDERGIHTKTWLDLCDCLIEGCEGCFFACPKCRSFKCGQECRQGRRWMYETYENQANGELITNQYLKR